MAFDRLRYRLLPYVYSVAWLTTHDRYTPMRPLVMDFRTDTRAAEHRRSVHVRAGVPREPRHGTCRYDEAPLPSRTKWFDFWTGREQAGGGAIDAAAPIDRMPLFVRAGSIVPLGPDLEWASQKPADPLELRVYRGADGAFTLYEDEGDSYNYEKGQFATVPFAWNEASQTLTIGERQGAFAGLLKERRFHVVFVGAGRGVGIEPEAKPDHVVTYTGRTMTVAGPKTGNR